MSVKLAHVSNKKLWSEIKGAGYREMRETFTVIGQMVDNESGKKMVRLRLSHVEHDGKEFDAAAGTCRLLRAGPPNMRFCDSPVQLGSAEAGVTGGAATDAVPAALPAAVPVALDGHPLSTIPIPAPAASANDGDESDLESIDEDQLLEPTVDQVRASVNAALTPGNLDFGDWQAPTDSHTIDARGIPKTPPAIVSHANPSHLDELGFFRIMIPESFIKEKIIPLTSDRLIGIGKMPVLYGEFLRWLGLWLIIGLNPAVDTRSQFWASEADSEPNPLFGSVPSFSKWMSRHRFEDILSCLALNDQQPPGAPKDRFWMIRELITAFNKNMSDEFYPSWLTCLDESMAAYLNTYCPGWTCVERKPHKFGNEIHTIACALTHIIFHMEFVEGKDQPQEGPHSRTEFDELGKTPGLCVRMTKSIHGSGRVVVLDSGFGQPAAVLGLKEVGLFSTAVIKKKRYWPRGVPGDNIRLHMFGKDVGIQQVFEGKEDKPYKGLWLGSMADSKHIALMCNSWATTNETGPRKKRRVGTDLVEFKYGEYQHYYYKGRNAVDANNQVRQGYLSLEHAAALRSWEHRVFMYVIATAEANAFLYNYFTRERAGLPKLSKAAFRRALAGKLVRNSMIPDPDATLQVSTSPDREDDRPHKLRTVPKHGGRFKDGRFPTIMAEYVKWPCYLCKRKVRTYCGCDPSRIVCSMCWHAHVKNP